MFPWHSLVLHSPSTALFVRSAAFAVAAGHAAVALANAPFPTGWKGKGLVVRGDKVVADVDATYVDSNGNGVMDPSDAGHFAPGSTVKVAIAMAAIEAAGGRGGLEGDIRSALVLSDNNATNRLIDRIGGTSALNTLLKERGFTHFVVGRKMMASLGADPRCEELPDRPGNCASARNLVRSLQAVVEGGVFSVSDDDREFVSKTLTLTPRAAGFSKADDYCRFTTLPGLQKCGVSPWAPTQWSNLAYIPARETYVFVNVIPPAGTPNSRIIAALDAATRSLLAGVPDAPVLRSTRGTASATYDTWLKLDPAEASTLDSSRKCALPSGTVLAFDALGDAGAHTRVDLRFADRSCPDFPTKGVFLYTPHWQIRIED